MMRFRRHAAALLCGAAAVHFLALVFHLGATLGLTAPAEGRALMLAVTALPALLLLWVVWDRGVGCWVFLLGAVGAHAANEWLLLPCFGYGVAGVVWGVGFVAALLVRGRREKAAAGGAWVGGAILGAGLGLAMGLAFTIVRPFLFEHVVATRAGVRIAETTVLAGFVAGAAMGQVLKRRLPRWAVATATFAFAGVSLATTALLLPKAAGGLVVPMLSGAWSATWWGRSVLGSWAILGLLSVAFGLSLPLGVRRRSVALLIVGIYGGTEIAEAGISAWSSDPASVRAVADRIARHPPMQSVSAAAIDADGISTRYRTRTALELESMVFRHGTRMDRGELWRNLEAAEIEPAGPEAPVVLGRAPGSLNLFDGPARDANPFATQRIADDMVVRSQGFLPAGAALSHPDARVGGLASNRKVFRAWCDPRALTAAGVKTLLATWRAALPEGRFVMLTDGYNGPLLGVRVGGEDAHFHIAEQLTLFEAPITSAFRGELGPPSTLMHPILEWQTAPVPSPFMHPDGDVMRALVASLAIPHDSAVDHLLRGLVLHAGAQAVRPYVVSPWDHVTIPDGEVEHVMTALTRDEHSKPVLRHLQIVLEVLLRKKEYAKLVRFGEEAVARRPDSLAFHRTLGKAYFEIRDFENAIEELSLAHALDPGHHELVIELSRALGSGKRWKDAVTLLEAEQLASPDPAVQKGLAISVFESGDLVRAEKLLKDVLERHPGDVDVMRALDQLDRQKK